MDSAQRLGILLAPEKGHQTASQIRKRPGVSERGHIYSQGQQAIYPILGDCYEVRVKL